MDIYVSIATGGTVTIDGSNFGVSDSSPSAGFGAMSMPMSIHSVYAHVYTH